MTARPLSPAETCLAHGIFGVALDVARVRIHDRPYLPWQAGGVAMAPNGQIYFHAADHRADFTGDVGFEAWLVHELVHVWQHQSGVAVRMRGLLEQLSRVWGGNPYRYGPLNPARPFSAYGLEQQAAIVEDFHRRRRGSSARHGAGSLADYAAVIPFPAA